MIGLQSVAVVVACGALYVSLTGIAARVSQNEAAIQSSAYNSCQLLRELIRATTARSVRPANQTRRIDAYIDHTPLRDCQRYALRVTRTGS